MADITCGIRRSLLATTAFLVATGSTIAHAQTACSQAPDGSVECTQGATIVASGTMTPGTVTDGPGLQADSAGGLDGSIVGDISTTANNGNAVFLRAADSIDYDQNGDLSTRGAGSVALFGRSEIDASVSVGDIATSGANAGGITISSGGIDEFDAPFGTINLTCGNVTTTGASSDAVVLSSGSVTASCGDVIATGPGSRGVIVDGQGVTSWGNIVSDSIGLSTSGRATVGDVVTYGDGGSGIRLSNENGGASVDCESVTTFGDDATGIDSFAYQGGNGVQCGDIVTYGNRSYGAGFTETGFSIGNVTTSGFNSGGVIAGGILYVSGTVGNVSTSGANSTGVRAESEDVELTTGNISTAGENSLGMSVSAWNAMITTGDVTTLGGGSGGIDVEAASSANVTCGNIATAGAGSDALRVVASNFLGSVTVRCGGLSATGSGSRGLIAGASGNVDIEIGDVVSDGFGINAGTSEGAFRLVIGNVSTSGDGGYGILASVSDGFGSLTCGDVTTVGSDARGIQTFASDGSLSVNCGNIRTEGDNSTGVAHFTDGLLTLASVTTLGNNSDGVLVGSDFGVRANIGNISTSGDNSAGLRIGSNASNITVGDVSTTGDGSVGVAVDGGYDGFDLDIGQVRTTGVDSHGIEVNFYTLSPSVTQLMLSVDGVAVSGASADAIRFDLIGTDVAPQILIGGDLTSEQGAAVRVNVGAQGQAGTGVFNFEVPEGLAVRGQTGGILVQAPGTVLDVAGAVEAVEGPAIQALGGPAEIRIQSTASVTGALIFGAGDDQFSNSGLITARGTSDFGDGSDIFANRGILRINGNVGMFGLERLANAGGTIDMQDGATDDRLTLAGDYTGGDGAAVLLDVSRSLDTADALVIEGGVSGNTILDLNWVDSSAPFNPAGVLLVDGVTDAELFSLQGAEDSGLFLLRLRARDGGLYLVEAVDPAATDFIVLGGLASDAWYQSFDAVRASIAGRGSLLPRLGIWSQVYGGSDRSGRAGSGDLFGVQMPFSTRMDTDRLGAQLGADASLAGMVVGATAGYERAKSDAGFSSGTDVHGFNLGVYASIGSAIGPYATGTVKADRLQVRFKNAAVRAPEVDASSTGADLELGWRLPLAAAFIDLNAAVSVVRSHVEGFAAEGLDFRPGSRTSVRGRLGARATFSGPLRPFAEARLFHEFGDSPSLELVSGDLRTRLGSAARGTWGRLEAGIAGGSKRPSVSGWADFGDRKGWGLRAGFRF